MKKFRITHNPYLKETKLEEYFEGATMPWGNLGGEDAPSLRNILKKNETIQTIGYDLLKWINDYRKEKSGKYEICYVGLEQDFEDVKKIADTLKKQNYLINLINIEQEKNFDSPKQLQDKLEKSVEEIIKLYEGEDELQNILRTCIEEKNSEINVLVVGMQNSGKSTLINAMLGVELLPTSGDVETAMLYSVRKAEYNYIKIIDEDSKEILIKYTDKITYGSDIEWVKEVVCEAINSEKFAKLSDIVSKMHYTLKMLNDRLKNRQHSGIYGLLKEIEIGLVNFDVLKSDFSYCIKDFPGAGATYLKEEHKKAIGKSIKDVKGAVILYVLDANDANYENVQVFLKEIKDLDAEQKEGILNQIDFERSIYVLNKADSLSRTVLENESNEKYRQFIDKKTVLCSAEPAMQLRVNGSMEGKHHVLFVNPIKAEEKLIDLREYALLSEPIKKRTLNVERNILSTKAGNEALDRTAVSLIGNLLDEYASNSASIHKVSSYYSRLDWMFKHLSDEEQNKITNYNKKKEDLEKKEVAVKNSLKQECDNSLNSFNDQHTKDNMKKNLRDDMNKEYVVICNKIENCFDKKMSKKEYIEEIKKEVNETIKGNFEKSDDNLGKYNKIAKNKKTALCQFYSDTLKKNLSAAQNREEINDDDWKEIEKCIDQFEKKDDWKDFTINKKFSIQEMSMKEILTRILRPRQWLKGKIIEEFSMHWDKNIIEPFSDDLCRQIKKSNETLTDDVKKQIDTISPCLVQLNIEKHDAERAKNKFIDNKNKAQELKESCKNMISRGTIYV